MNTMNTILYLLGEFTAPLHGDNPKIIGNLGERRLAVKPRYFNPSTHISETVPAGPLKIELGNMQAVFEAPAIIMNPGDNVVWPMAHNLSLDVGGANFPTTGEFTLRVTRGELSASIVVRIRETDLDLVSPWPLALSVEELARDEAARLAGVIHETESEIDRVHLKLGELRSSLVTAQARLSKLEEFLG